MAGRPSGPCLLRVRDERSLTPLCGAWRAVACRGVSGCGLAELPSRSHWDRSHQNTPPPGPAGPSRAQRGSAGPAMRAPSACGAEGRQPSPACARLRGVWPMARSAGALPLVACRRPRRSRLRRPAPGQLRWPFKVAGRGVAGGKLLGPLSPIRVGWILPRASRCLAALPAWATRVWAATTARHIERLRIKSPWAGSGEQRWALRLEEKWCLPGLARECFASGYD